MPTQTNEVDAVAQATEPVTFDWGYGDPDLPAISSGNSRVGDVQDAGGNAGRLVHRADTGRRTVQRSGADGQGQHRDAGQHPAVRHGHELVDG